MNRSILRLALPAAALLFVSPAAAQSGCGAGYTVRPGDTLYSIARRCGTSVSAIARANGIADATRIEVGVHLRMPGHAEPPRHYAPPRAPEPPVRYEPRHDPEPPVGHEPPHGPEPDHDEAQRLHGSYRVQPGDTLLSIARRFGFSAADLMAANPRVYPYDLRPGTLLTLPMRGPRPPEDRYPDDDAFHDGGKEDWDDRDRDDPENRWDDDYREPPRDTRPDYPRYPDRPGPVYPEPPPFPGPGRDELVVTGVITDEGVECAALRGFDGRLYTLAGDTDRLREGDVVTVRGSRAQISFCQQGTTIAVRTIERARR